MWFSYYVCEGTLQNERCDINRGLFYELLQVAIWKCGNSLILYQPIYLGNNHASPCHLNLTPFISYFLKMSNHFFKWEKAVEGEKKTPLMQCFSWKFNDTKGRQFKLTGPVATVTLLYSTFRHRFHSMYLDTKYSSLGLQGGRVMVAMGTMTLNFQIFGEFKFSTRTSH